MTPEEAQAISDEAFELTRQCRAERCDWLADFFAHVSDEMADQACDLKRRMGIQQEDVA